MDLSPEVLARIEQDTGSRPHTPPCNCPACQAAKFYSLPDQQITLKPTEALSVCTTLTLGMLQIAESINLFLRQGRPDHVINGMANALKDTADVVMKIVAEFPTQQAGGAQELAAAAEELYNGIRKLLGERRLP